MNIEIPEQQIVIEKEIPWTTVSINEIPEDLRDFAHFKKEGGFQAYRYEKREKVDGTHEYRILGSVEVYDEKDKINRGMELVLHCEEKKEGDLVKLSKPKVDGEKDEELEEPQKKTKRSSFFSFLSF